MPAQHVLQRHLRHAALAAANDGLAPQVLPVEGLIGAAHEEGAVPACQLAKHHRIVVFALIINVDAAFRPGKADVALTRYHGGHHLVGSAAVGQLHRKAFLLKKTKLHGHILRRVKYGMGHFVETDRGQPFAAIPGAAATQQRQQHQSGKHRCDDFFHAFTPNK